MARIVAWVGVGLVGSVALARHGKVCRIGTMRMGQVRRTGKVRTVVLDCKGSDRQGVACR